MSRKNRTKEILDKYALEEIKSDADATGGRALSEKYGINPRLIYAYLGERCGWQNPRQKEIKNILSRVDLEQLIEDANSFGGRRLARKYNAKCANIYSYLRHHSNWKNPRTINHNSDGRRGKYYIAPQFFDNITPDKEWVLNFIREYGTNKGMCLTISVPVEELDMLRLARRQMDCTIPIKEYRNKQGKVSRYILNISRRHICDQLDILGIPINKSIK